MRIPLPVLKRERIGGARSLTREDDTMAKFVVSKG